MRDTKGKDKDQHMSLRDRIRFQFKDKGLGSFQSQLASHKLTLAISLQFLTLESSSTSQVASFPTDQEARVLQAIEQQNVALGHCYIACIAALRATTQATGNTYRYVSAADEAKLLVGNVGDVAGSAGHLYEEISAAGNANVILGNMQSERMRDFFR
ncbi:hypothetical protein BDW67DRAFT_184750 [Aspergillus spinulosporus]